MADFPAMATASSISGIIPAGGSKTWSFTARDTIKELIEGADNCKVVPKVGAISGCKGV